MNKKYKIDNLWLVKLGETTEFKNGGRREGYTKWRELPQIYFAKKIETDIYGKSTFKLISSGMKVTDDHSTTTVGDVFVFEKHHASLAFERETLDRNYILRLEGKLNNPNNKKELSREK